MSKAIMIQGAGSNVGKSIIVAGLLRAAKRRGLKVAPFKPQNMSNNAAVTIDGGEIGRAQALQALAAGTDPVIDMNPVLLKPETDIGSQIVVQGKRLGSFRAREYGSLKGSLLPKVIESFERLRNAHDLVIVEGAGSPAEINLREGDIANMGFAAAVDCPVILIGDIDRGGVIAQIAGTDLVLSQSDRDLIKGFAINKFRGDPLLFAEGMSAIAQRTAFQPLGIIPWFDNAWRLPAEDIMDIAGKHGGNIKIAVPRLNRIANYDDLDPLSAMPNVTIELVRPGEALPGDADLVLIPGSKSTMADLQDFRNQGWDIDLKGHIRRGGHVLGICGGYQMLGTRVSDPDGIEGIGGEMKGLDHLNVETILTPRKTLALSHGKCLDSGEDVSGYEIHLGHTDGADTHRPWLEMNSHRVGAQSADGRIKGCYVHGLFTADGFRDAYLSSLGLTPDPLNYSDGLEATLNELADHLERHLDVDVLLSLAT